MDKQNIGMVTITNDGICHWEVKSNDVFHDEPPTEETSSEKSDHLDLNQKGMLNLSVNIPNGFTGSTIVVELLHKTTGKIHEIQLHKINNFTKEMELPVGDYMTYSVLSTDDNPLNPQWLFEVGYKFTLNSGESHTFEINPGGSLIEAEDDENVKVTDTELSPEDLMIDEGIGASEN